MKYTAGEYDPITIRRRGVALFERSSPVMDGCFCAWTCGMRDEIYCWSLFNMAQASSAALTNGKLWRASPSKQAALSLPRISRGTGFPKVQLQSVCLKQPILITFPADLAMTLLKIFEMFLMAQWESVTRTTCCGCFRYGGELRCGRSIIHVNSPTTMSVQSANVDCRNAALPRPLSIVTCVHYQRARMYRTKGF